MFIVRPSSFFQRGAGGRVNFITSTGEGGGLKNKKRGGSMVQGQVFLEGDTFPIQVFQDLSFLHLEITLPFAKLCYTPLQNCATHLKKIIFFCHHNFGKKIIQSCLKINLKLSKKLR